MKIAVCQFNPVVGDIEGNKKRILEGYQKGIKEGVDLVILPELFLCGYPPQDLVEKREFRYIVAEAVQEIAKQTSNVGLIFGTITEEIKDFLKSDVYNSSLLCYDGHVQFIQNKTLLPNFDVIDEVRYFNSAKEVTIHQFKGERLGISISEDIEFAADYWKKQPSNTDPVQKQIDFGADILINISASAYSYGKRKERYSKLSVLSKKYNVPLVQVCCVGAQTELIFDGTSMCYDSKGDLCLIGKSFEEDFFVFDTRKLYNRIMEVESCFEEEVLNALILGLKDYTKKTGFKKALVGLSGGIDSALVTYIAVAALGKENVHVVLMPSKYSSEGSIKDSEKLIKCLGISSNLISIQPVVDKTIEMLSNELEFKPEDITEENLQARIRGLYLMAFSNKYNYLLCTTGNKSEFATGYSTLYGDTCGTLAVIGDVYKTQVYKLAEYINREKESIPKEIIDKVPSAELKPGQTDQDSLPPYELLDKILKMYLEEQKEYNKIVMEVLEPDIVKKVLRLVDINEFKRKQSAPVLRVSTKAFGSGRRYPVVQGWRR